MPRRGTRSSEWSRPSSPCSATSRPRLPAIAGPGHQTIAAVIPTHNRAALVERAVLSARREGFEVVVVDDASSDDTEGRMAPYVAQGVTYVRLERNSGRFVARAVGVERTSADLIVYLDDDDEMIEGSGAVIAEVAARHAGRRLFMHNLLAPDGRTTIPREDRVVPLTYYEWLAGTVQGDLVPVVRRELLAAYPDDDPIAGGGGLLWGRILRSEDAVVSRRPIIQLGEQQRVERLGSGFGLLGESDVQAAIALRFLDEFGDDLRARHPNRWRQRVLAAATWLLLSGRRREAVAVAGALGPGVRALVAAATVLPRGLLRALYLARRRELLSSIRAVGLRRSLGATRS